MLSRRMSGLLSSLRHKKYRKLHGLFLAEGIKIVDELLRSSFAVHSVFAVEQWIEANRHKVPTTTDIISISEQELHKISQLHTPQQVVAMVRIPDIAPDYATMTDDFILALDELQDSGNLGTILRTADWFGIKWVVCSHGCVDLYNPKTVQATMGSIARVKVCYLDLKGFLSNLHNKIPVYGAVLDGSSISTVAFSTPGILVIGNEAHGLSPGIKPFISQPVSISAYPAVSLASTRPESLNASVAAAIALYE
ncbi:MAG TPA: RNA methyltransferase, partial [Bacteroidales bacterium]|nr:RNA methyltransferase [Bacteroidales bacterium]